MIESFPEPAFAPIGAPEPSFGTHAASAPTTGEHPSRVAETDGRAEEEAKSVNAVTAENPFAEPEIEILPGEQLAEFRALREALIQEWRPSGPIEDDAVLTLAIDLWRKRRFRRWRQRKVEFDAHGQRRSELEYLETKPVPFSEKITDPVPQGDLICGAAHIDDFVRLLYGSNGLATSSNLFWARSHLILLPQKYQEHLEHQVPAGNFDDYHARDYVRALKEEIDNVLLPQAANELREKFGSIDAEKLVADALSPERLVEELEMEARLDAAVDRSLKRLGSLKKPVTKELARDPKPGRGRPRSSSAADWGRVRYVN